MNFFAPPSSSSNRIGLIAGWGTYPLVVADRLAQSGHQVVCAGILGHADEALRDRCHAFRWTGLARLGAQIRFLRRHGVGRAVLAGKIHKKLIFQKGFAFRQRPDLQCIRTFFPHFITGRKNRTDDSLLLAAVEGYGRGGVEIIPATTLIPELLVNDKTFGRRTLSRRQLQDIEFGWNLAKEMGRLDVGQTVAVKGQAVLAVEAVEGTDQCIRRAGLLCPHGGFTVVKVSKPQQDMRFDLPTIGIGTLQTLRQAGGTTLAVETDKTIVLDAPRLQRFAEENGIAMVAIRDGQVIGPALQSAA